MGIVAATAVSLIAVFGAAGAGATFNSEVAPTTVLGENTGTHVISVAGFSLGCGQSAVSGEMSEREIQQLALDPTLEECNFQGYNTKWSTSGCQYVFNPPVEGSSTGSVDIDCEPGESISYQIPGCVVTIGPQQRLGAIEYSNESGDVLIEANLEGITYDATGFLCPEGGADDNGTYVGSWLVGGSSAGESVSIEVQPDAPSENPHFVSEEAPMVLDAVSTSPHVFDLGYNGSGACEKAAFSGEESESDVAGISLDASYEKCTFLGFSVEVDRGGCEYQLAADGEFAIGGSGCGEDPITVVAPGCTVKIGPQSGLADIAYANQSSGKGRTVSVDFDVDGIAYSASGFLCPDPGSHADGGYSGSATLAASNGSSESQGISVE